MQVTSYLFNLKSQAYEDIQINKTKHTWIRYLYKTGQCPYHEHVFEAVF